MWLQESFESVADCKERTKKDADQIKMGLKKQHDHIGYIKWVLEEYIREVSQLTDGSHINFSELARKYLHNNDNGEILKNGGQIVKEALKKKLTSTDLNIMERLISQDFVVRK